MSAAATARAPAGSAEAAVTPSGAPNDQRQPSTNLILGLALAAGLLAVAFVTRGGVDDQIASAGNTWVNIAVTVLGAGAVGALVAAGAPARRWGWTAVLLLGALTALKAVSIAWSFSPDSSWMASNQAVAYLAAFAGAWALVQLAPQRWPSLLVALAMTMTVLCGWSLLVKVFPATLAASNIYGRLVAPFGYWNAIGLCGALGLPACLWAGARRGRGRSLAGLAAPAVCLLISVLVLSYSRSTDAAAGIAIALWLVFVPLRLRSVAVLALGAVGAAPISAWMLTHHALKDQNVAMSAQDSAGHTFGIVIAVVLVVMIITGFWLARAMDRVRLPGTVRRGIGQVLCALVVVAVIGAIGAVAASSRGLTGEVSHAWHSLTDTHSSVSAANANRVFEFGSSRPLYWHQAIDVGHHNLFKGVGELGFGVARLQYTTNTSIVQQAHSYAFETFADLGVLGVLLTLALLVAWVAASRRPLMLRSRWESLTAGITAEREAMFALAATVVAYGIQSTLDWTWYFAGVTIPVLVCAGWLAGRGPLGADAQGPPRGVGTRNIPRRPLLERPVAAVGLVALVAVTLVVAWFQWRPWESVNHYNASINAATTAQAFDDARAATHSDPLALQPRLRLAILYQNIGAYPQARDQYLKAVRSQPHSQLAWLDLGSFEYQHAMPQQAIKSLSRVLQLDHSEDWEHVTAVAAIKLVQPQLKPAAAKPPSQS